MSEIPTQDESLLNDDPKTFEFAGATSSDVFTTRDTSSIGGELTSSESGGNLLFNVYIPLGLLAVAGAVVFMLGSIEPEQRPAADNSRNGRLQALPSVRVERVQSLESLGTQLQLKVDGSVVPYREAKIAAEVAGRIVLKADECEAGNYVKKDQLLMVIDPTDYELDVQRLSRMQEQEYQALQEVDQEMANTTRLLEVAQQDLALQQKEVDRQKSLPAGFASRAEIDQAERGLLQSRQQLVTWQNQLDLLKKRRVRLEASERLAATQLKAAEINLQRTEIRAPIEGVIVFEDAEMNTFVARGNTLVTIEDTSKVEVATNLRMDQLYWVLDQQRGRSDDSSRGYDLPETPAIIEYEVAGRDGVKYRWNGRLLRYDGIGLDPSTRTVPVRVLVDDPRQYIDEQGKVKSSAGATALVRGMFVQVNLLIKPLTPLVVVPARALKPGNRVWQFVPDESVLDLPVASDSTSNAEAPNDGSTEESVSDETAEISPSTNLANSAVESEDDETKKFDPKKWLPGQVVVRRSVTPVDSLSVDPEADANADRFDYKPSPENRLWVCEVRDQKLQDGSFVVVSPLGFVDVETVAARADAEIIAGTIAKTSPQKRVHATSTASSEVQSGAEAVQ